MRYQAMAHSRHTGLDSNSTKVAKRPKLRRSPRLEKLRGKTFNMYDATKEEIAERVLCDYNKKHGTKLEFVGLQKGAKSFMAQNVSIDFQNTGGVWLHFNFEARRGGDGDADPSSDKPLLLFAELLQNKSLFHLITLSIVKPTDESNGCPRCSNCVSHPRHGIRAGLIREPNMLSGPTIWTENVAASLSVFALKSYNKKHGTTIKFERALNCCSFSCYGLSMDFQEKNTEWVHMNFEARVGVGRRVRVVCLFAELYKEGDNGEYVLATLSPAPPAMDAVVGHWRMVFTGVQGCVFCPADILHPKAFRFAHLGESSRVI